jgi:hypothetical protein
MQDAVPVGIGATPPCSVWRTMVAEACRKRPLAVVEPVN